MYDGVPSDIPSRVMPPSAELGTDGSRFCATLPITFEIPKSATTADACVNRMFSGLMSRCTTPLPCA